jgi:PAS domain S-box-containing protein
MPAGDVMPENLIRTLLQAGLEETGAQRARVILSRNGQCRIAAEATRRPNGIVVQLRDEVAIASLLPASVLRHVLRTRKSVVIGDAAGSAFASDPYLRQHKVGSILGLPLLAQAKLVGVLLLESDLPSGVFTGPRIKLLKLVAALGGSALENLRLYHDLREREAQMRRLIDANIIGIYLVDIRGPILESNDAYLRMLGYRRSDLALGLRWTDLTPPEWHDADKRRVETVKRIGRLQPFEKEFFRKDGGRIPVLMGVARLKAPQTRAVVFALDMSKQKRAEAIRSETRLIQHSRVARKLQDDLLQNFQGMMFQFQAARNLMGRHPEEALRSLNEAIKEGQTVLDEGRDAIVGLG